MNFSSRTIVGSATLFVVMAASAVVWSQPSSKATIAERRAAATKLQTDGNFKEALQIYREFLLEPKNKGGVLPIDIRNAVTAIRRLNRYVEADALLEGCAELHSDDWRVLEELANQYRSLPHSGMIIAGTFERAAGYGRRGGRVVQTTERDRARSLQLLEQARELIAKSQTPSKVAAGFHLNLAQHLMSGRARDQAWRLQHLTDLKSLPDYEDGYGRASPSAAPVDEEGNPVLHAPSKTWEKAATDGQRWRWAMQQAVELSPDYAGHVAWQRCQFLESQFSVVTLQRFGWFRQIGGSGNGGETSKGILSLQTLSDEETVCRLATGVKRFKLPPSHNYLEIYKQLVREEASEAMMANDRLAVIYSNRMQFPKSAERWSLGIRKFGRNQHREISLAQIVGNWGQFDSTITQAAGTGAVLQYRFRNGKRVRFTAQRINVDRLLADVKKYLQSNPDRPRWDQYQIGNIGYRLSQENKERYIQEEVASWSLDLEPRAAHFDKRIDVATPLQKGGAYLVTAKMDQGNSSAIVIWVTDTALIHKRMQGRSLYLAADAANGQPIANVEADFFGFRTSAKREGRKTVYSTSTKSFSTKGDSLGRITPIAAEYANNMQWFVVAHTADGRFAHLGFHGAWTGQRYDPVYDQRKVYVVTDRPVYRPKHKVQFKCWVKRARFDAPEGASEFANRRFTVDILDPKGAKVLTKSLTSDRFGGFQGEYELPKDAALGAYRVSVRGVGGGTGLFRVEEYKKPEFEVLVKAPDKPIQLGEKFKAKVTAKYYFGAPVQEATVKVKVTRSEHQATWFPYAPWDWFYGPGYWWFAGDYSWYRGSQDWLGCFGAPLWPSYFGANPPELVLELERPIGADGQVEVEIDSAIAKAIHGDSDHKYSITAEVRDASRRTIVGAGNVIAARKPFMVYAWVDRGFYQVGAAINARFKARTLDNRAIQGDANVKLLRITYDKNGDPIEKLVRQWESRTDEDGKGAQTVQAAAAGQYRLAITVSDDKGNSIEGGYVFTVRGEGDDGSEYRFDTVELISEKQEYRVGDTVKLQVNTDRPGSTVYLFARAVNGVYLPPKIVKLEGKSAVQELKITKADMPNIYVEAMTVSDGKVHTAVRQIVVPPEKRVLNVDVVPNKDEYLPQEQATIKVHVTDHQGENYVGSTAISVYDKALEYVSGGPNFSDIREYFWKWKRQHRPYQLTNLGGSSQGVKVDGAVMRPLGAFGNQVADVERSRRGMAKASAAPSGGLGALQMSRQAGGNAAMAMDSAMELADGGSPGQAPLVEPTVRSEFADTAFWKAAIVTDENGMAEVSLNMPDNLTTWKVQAWGVGHGARVGSGSAEVITTKNVIVRLQAPRFFTERDEAVLSAVVHNYLDTSKRAEVSIHVEGPIELRDDSKKRIEIEADGEQRVDWRVRITGQGEALIRMTAKTDTLSDAMEMTFPCQVFGAERVESFVGSIRGGQNKGIVNLDVPLKRRIDQSRLEVRYSPSLAGAMVDALPYLAEYPYGCTEQTLNRFLPAAITQRTLQRMQLDLAQIKRTRTNLNAQEIGDARKRAKQWKRFDENPVFDIDVLDDMVKTGVKRLREMQNPDGGWGWFSGRGARSWPHTTLVVVRGLLVAQQNDVDVDANSLKRGLDWLASYQTKEVDRILAKGGKVKASHLDALVYQVLVSAKRDNMKMRELLYRDRIDIGVYGKAAFALALHEVGDQEKLQMVMRNIRQFLVDDDENETSRLDVGRGAWWTWHGNEIEANAFYLKLLAKADPDGATAPRIVKYLLNNRKHATYWKSTRDTALCVEAFADYLKSSDELNPDMTVEVWFDGEKKKELRITRKNLFTFDNRFVLEGDLLEGGRHRLELRRRGRGSLYYNAYLSNFTLEDEIAPAGLEVKVERKFYKLTRRKKTQRVVGDRGQSLSQNAEAYDRTLLTPASTLKSGDLVEVELKMTSKNDYEYILFEDMKAAGLEPVDIRSGYMPGATLSVYREIRDNRVGFFMRALPRGVHSLSYRLRAETPGLFGALPAQAYGMYAPELRGNSRNERVSIVD